MSNLRIIPTGEDDDSVKTEQAAGASAGDSDSDTSESKELQETMGAGACCGETKSREITGSDARKIKHFFEADLSQMQRDDNIFVEYLEPIGSSPSLKFTVKSLSVSVLTKKIEDLQTKLQTLHVEEIHVGSKLDKAKKLCKSLTSENVFLYPGSEESVFIWGTDYMEVTNAKRQFRVGMGMEPVASSRAGRKFDTESSYRELSDNNSRLYSNDENTTSSKFVDWSFTTPNGLLFKCYKHAITTISCDAIVNAANDVMKHGGGVAQAIAKAAGYNLVKESDEYVNTYGNVLVTENCITTGGNLPCKWVIHAVGPQWSDYKRKEDCLWDLCQTMRKVLEQADKRKLRTIVTTAISAGIFGVPKQLCAEMYIKSAVDYDTKANGSHVRELHFVDIKNDILLEVRKAYEKWQKDPQSLSPQRAIATGNWSQGGAQGSAWRKNSGPLSDSQVDSNKLCFQFGKTRKMSVYIYVKDITKLTASDVDAIVSTEDREIGTRGGVSKAIMNAAGGDSIYKEEIKKQKKNNNKFDYGDFFITSAGLLPVHRVIHVICPSVGRYKTESELLLLSEAIAKVLKFIDRQEGLLDRVAMPLPGSGMIEKDEELLSKCCQTVFTAIQEFANSAKNLREVHIVSLKHSTNETLGREFQKMSKKCKDVSQVNGSESSNSHFNQKPRGRGRGGGRGSGRWSQQNKNGGLKGQNLGQVIDVIHCNEDGDENEDNSKFWESVNKDNTSNEEPMEVDQPEGCDDMETPPSKEDDTENQAPRGNLRIISQ